MDDLERNITLFVLICILFALGVFAGIQIGEQSSYKLVNEIICKQLYKDTETYLKQVEKPWTENVAKISECEGNNEIHSK